MINLTKTDNGWKGYILVLDQLVIVKIVTT